MHLCKVVTVYKYHAFLSIHSWPCLNTTATGLYIRVCTLLSLSKDAAPSCLCKLSLSIFCTSTINLRTIADVNVYQSFLTIQEFIFRIRLPSVYACCHWAYTNANVYERLKRVMLALSVYKWQKWVTLSYTILAYTFYCMLTVRSIWWQALSRACSAGVSLRLELFHLLYNWHCSVYDYSSTGIYMYQ
jgi:hypothetical protein